MPLDPLQKSKTETEQTDHINKMTEGEASKDLCYHHHPNSNNLYVLGNVANHNIKSI